MAFIRDVLRDGAEPLAAGLFFVLFWVGYFWSSTASRRKTSEATTLSRANSHTILLGLPVYASKS